MKRALLDPAIRKGSRIAGLRSGVFRIVGLAALAALAACSSPYNISATTPPAVTTTTIAGGNTPALTKASDLRAQLTYLLVEHVYLLDRALQGHSDDAAAAVEANGKDIAALLGDAYGPAFQSQFSTLWSARAAAYLAHNKDDIASSSAAFADFIHASNKYLAVHTVTNPPTGMGDEVKTIDGLCEKFVDDPTQVTAVVAAAEAIPHTAEMLAAATAKLFPDKYPGTAAGTAANLRSSLTELAVENVELSVIAGGAAATGKDSGPPSAALDHNSSQLHNAISSIYDDATAVRFDNVWDAGVTATLAYAKARAANDQAGLAAASAQLDSFGPDFGAFLGSVTAGRVSAADAGAAMGAQVQALRAVIDGAATNANDEAARIRTAASGVAPWTAKVAEAVAEQFNTRYLP